MASTGVTVAEVSTKLIVGKLVTFNDLYAILSINTPLVLFNVSALAENDKDATPTNFSFVRVIMASALPCSEFMVQSCMVEVPSIFIEPLDEATFN